MRRLIVGISLVLASVSISVATEIREFSVPTLERLGNEIYHRDRIAARASDLVLKTYPVARSLKMRGWISDPRKEGDTVYWITETPSGPSLAYTVTFHGSDKPDLQDVRGQPLPPRIAVRYKARQTAFEAVKGRLFNIPYNYEVLNDPDGSGFLVYAIGDTGKPGDVVIAGHFRITVSADGEKAERVDGLSRSLMIDNRNKDPSPQGYHREMFVMSQIVSSKPVETLIYSSYRLGLPIAVAAVPDGQMWTVRDGKIIREKNLPTPKQK
jgi:hypothetical protein